MVIAIVSGVSSLRGQSAHGNISGVSPRMVTFPINRNQSMTFFLRGWPLFHGVAMSDNSRGVSTHANGSRFALGVTMRHGMSLPLFTWLETHVYCPSPLRGDA
jgi:hypothetical protein